MYLTPRMGETGEKPNDNIKYTKGWNGVLFVHNGPYEEGVFKFKIDFTLKYPLDLPIVMFAKKAVYNPYVKFESGKFDIQALFAKSMVYDDENYIAGQLI